MLEAKTRRNTAKVGDSHFQSRDIIANGGLTQRYPSSGSRRVFKQFVWLGVGPV